MNPLPVTPTKSRIQVAKSFAQQFNHFEWEYLCSYQWFLTGIDRALETGISPPWRLERNRHSSTIKSGHAGKRPSTWATLFLGWVEWIAGMRVSIPEGRTIFAHDRTTAV